VRKAPEALQADRYAPVTAIRPEINADRPFRVALRRLEAKCTQALRGLEARIQALDDECAQCYVWINMTKERAEAAEAWAKAAAGGEQAAETRAQEAEARAQTAEAQLERLRIKNEQKRLLLDKYRRLFGWLEKLPSLK
jgi:chromosome segregation ATPase